MGSKWTLSHRPTQENRPKGRFRPYVGQFESWAMGPLTFFLGGRLAKRGRALLKGVSTLQNAGESIEQRLGNYLSFWRSSDRVYVVKKQRNGGGKVHRKARTI